MKVGKLIFLFGAVDNVEESLICIADKLMKESLFLVLAVFRVLLGAGELMFESEDDQRCILCIVEC